MQYIIDGEFYKITRVTGPKHNMLGVWFSDTDKEMEVVDLDSSAKQVNFSADWQILIVSLVQNIKFLPYNLLVVILSLILFMLSW